MVPAQDIFRPSSSPGTIARIWKGVREIIACTLFAVAFAVAAIPSLIAVLAFAVVAILCILVVTVAAIVASAAAIPAIVMMPGGAEAIARAAREA